MGVRPTEVRVQREVEFDGGCLRDRQAGAQDGVGAESRLVVGAVEVEHDTVEEPLIGGVEPFQRVGDLVVDEADGIQHALAAVAVAAVSELDGFVFSGRRPRRHRRPPERSGVEEHLDLDGGVATRIEDLASGDAQDFAHVPNVSEGEATLREPFGPTLWNLV